MTRKSSHQYHLANENCLLKQKYTELTEKIQLLDAEIQELRTRSGEKNNHHANTLLFLQTKNSELSKALLEKTNDNMKLQNQLYINKPGSQTSYNIDFSDEPKELPVPPGYHPVPPIHIIPTHQGQPKDIDRHWRYHGGHHHGGHSFPFYHDYYLYRDISGNIHHPIHKSPPHPTYPGNKKPNQTLKEFDNPLLHNYERAYKPPQKKPTHFIPPAIHHE